MANTYQAGLKFERINAGVYRVINIKGRIIANITRQTFSTNWMLKINYREPLSKKTLSDAKSFISDPTYKFLHLAEA